MSASATDVFPMRVAPNAAHAFGGIWRLTARRFLRPMHWLILAGMLGLLVVFSLPVTQTPQDIVDDLGPWMGRFYIGFLVPLLAFISAASQMRDDLKPDSVDYLLTRPVRRPLFIVFRWLSHQACDQIDFLCAFGVVVGLGVYWEFPGFVELVPRLLLAQVLIVAAASAFGYFCGLLTSRYIILGLAYGAIVEIGIGNVPTQLNQLSMNRHVLGILRPLLSVEDAIAKLPPVSLAVSTAVVLGFAIFLVAATAALFTFKELAGADGRDA